MQNILKIIYAVFIGSILTLLVGLGISAFYPAPEYPEYPRTKFDQPMPDQRAQDEFDQKVEQYDKDNKSYSRNVSIFLLVVSVVILCLSLVLSSHIKVIADGLLLGSVFTLIYSIIASFQADNQKFMFIIVVIGFIVSILIGYLKFIRPDVLAAKKV